MHDDYFTDLELKIKKPYSFVNREPYVFTVAAVNSAGTSNYSSATGPDTIPSTTPSITSFTASLDKTKDRNITLNFSIDNGGLDITNINILSMNASSTTDSTATMVTVANVIPGTVVSGFIPYTINLASGITNLTPTISTSTSGIKSSDSSGYSSTGSFTVTLTGNYFNPTSTSSYYNFLISATNSAGTTTSSLQSVQFTAPDSPTNFSAVLSSDYKTLTVSYSLPTNIGGLKPSYNLYVSTSLTGTQLLNSTGIATIPLVVSSTSTLNKNTTYYAFLNLLNSVGSSPQLTSSSFIVYDVPSSPGSLIGSSTTTGKIKISFPIPTAPSGAPIQFYNVVPYYTTGTGTNEIVYRENPIQISATAANVVTNTGTNTVTITLNSSDRSKTFDISKLANATINSSTLATGPATVTTSTQPYAYVSLDNYPTTEGYHYKGHNGHKNLSRGYEIYVEHKNYRNCYILGIVFIFALVLMYYWYCNNRKKNTKKY